MSTDESVRAHPADDAAEGEGSTDLTARRPGARRKARRDRKRAQPETAPAAASTVVLEKTTDDSDDTGGTGGTGDTATGVTVDPPPAPRFWHRAHPVFTPLSGFFTGVLLVVVVLGLLGAILDFVGFDISESPWVFLVALGVLLAADLVLVFVEGTRRFARYMLFGILITPAVVFVVAALTFYLLLQGDA